MRRDEQPAEVQPEEVPWKPEAPKEEVEEVPADTPQPAGFGGRLKIEHADVP
jgi:hypothetical protein